MATKTTAGQREKLDRLAELLKGTTPARLRTAIVKSESLTIRLTLSDKTSMEQTAKHCGLTLTDYLTRLHWFAAEKLEGSK